MNINKKKIYSKINNENDYVVFGLTQCNFCNKTKYFLKNYNISYKYYPIDNFKQLFFKNFVNLANDYPNLNIDPRHTTVPVIFYKKKFIGGYTDLVKKLNYNN